MTSRTDAVLKTIVAEIEKRRAELDAAENLEEFVLVLRFPRGGWQPTSLTVSRREMASLGRM